MFVLFMGLFLALFLGCSQQPMESSLLTSAKSGESTGEEIPPEEAQLDIQPDNTSIVVNIDDSDRVEITGSCKDLDRKKNRILVEVFAGEDENTLTPYISNAISDACQTIDAGLPTTDKCFWVTKGVGIVENAGLATERSFPQCHNGRFGFSVKLGKILVPASGPNLKYTIRFKLRTLDGILSDTAYSRVTVTRELNTPVVDSASQDIASVVDIPKCNIKTSPARFNFGIRYSLTRTYTDAAGTVNAPLTRYSNVSTSDITDGSSVFSFADVSTGGANLMLQGVSYNYTLTSTEANFAYATAPTSSSSVVTCTTAQLKLSPTPPAPTAGTCYLQLLSAVNTFWGAGVTYEWAYSTTSSWVGPTSSAQTGFNLATCGSVSACTQAGLVAGTTYYFAVRELSAGQIGKWSDVFSCKPL